MPVQNLVDPSHRLVVTTFSGEVTWEEVIASLHKLRDHPDFQPGYRQLIDLMRLSHTELNSNDLFGICHGHDPFSNEGRRAIVAPIGSLAFGLGRMYQAMVGTPPMNVFGSPLEAMAWLGLEAVILGGTVTKAAGSFFPAEPARMVLAGKELADANLHRDLSDNPSRPAGTAEKRRGKGTSR